MKSGIVAGYSSLATSGRKNGDWLRGDLASWGKMAKILETNGGQAINEEETKKG